MMNSLPKNLYLESLHHSGSLELLFRSVSDIFFYIKNNEAQVVTCNPALLRMYKLTSTEQLAHFDEAEFFRSQVIEPIHRDDIHVLETGLAVENRIELINDENGKLSWVLTNKVPIFSRRNEIIGLLGLTRLFSKNQPIPPLLSRFDAALEHIEQFYSSEIRIKTLADMACISESQFRRSFRKVFNMSPQKFILRYRIQIASQMLSETDLDIIKIATKCGFSDQSYFTRQFTAMVGMPPKKFSDQQKSLQTKS